LEPEVQALLNEKKYFLQSIMADGNEKVVVAENNNAQDPTFQLDYSVKHPLHSTWTLWFDNPGRKNSAQNWAQNLKEVFSFSTVEDFWRYKLSFSATTWIYDCDIYALELGLQRLEQCYQGHTFGCWFQLLCFQAWHSTRVGGSNQ
jgi:hypothetical protein